MGTLRTRAAAVRRERKSRDAIVIQAVCAESRGRAFGFHRATDTLGAVLGPLLGVALLGHAQGWHWSEDAGPFRFVLVAGYALGAATAGLTALAFWSDINSVVLLRATVGVIWTVFSPELAFTLAAGFMLVGTIAVQRVRD